MGIRELSRLLSALCRGRDRGKKLLKAKVLVIGLEGAGKAEFLRHVMNGVESKAGTPRLPNNVTSVAVDIENEDEIVNVFIHGFPVRAVIFIVDITDRARFAELGDYLEALVRAEITRDVPILVLGHKKENPKAPSTSELRYELGLGRPNIAAASVELFTIPSLAGRGPFE